MTEQALTPRPEEPELTPFEVIERVISSGDLGRMTPADRVAFYWRTCESLGLNPLTRPFEYLNLDGKIVLYARKDATEQLRQLNGVSITSLRREKDDDLGLLTVYAQGIDRTGRTDEASGVVSIKGLSGMALANAAMKAETKAKRRLTLSLCGLGFLDESEVEGLGDRVDVNLKTGEITDTPKPTLLETVQRQAVILSSEPSEETIEASFMAEPMTEEASAAVVSDEEALHLPEYDDVPVPPTPARTDEAPPAEPKGLSVKELSDLSRAAGLNKQQFAKALDVLPADVGKTIELMTDGQRHDLAEDLGLVPA